MEQFKIKKENDFVVVVFTKNRIYRLYKTLPRLPANNYDIVLLDESTTAKYQMEVKKLCEKYGLI